jgi:hypothetical protein
VLGTVSAAAKLAGVRRETLHVEAQTQQPTHPRPHYVVRRQSPCPRNHYTPARSRRPQANVQCRELGDVRIRYEEASTGFPLLVTPGGGLNTLSAKGHRSVRRPGGLPTREWGFEQDRAGANLREAAFEMTMQPSDRVLPLVR